MLKFGDTSLSYRQVDAVTGRVAAGLRAAGLGPGDKYPREVRLVDDLPKGPSGIVLKTDLRAQL